MDKMSKFESYSRFLTWFAAALVVSLAAGCGSATSNFSSIAVTPATASVPIGGTQKFVATGTAPNGTTSDISATVTWTSSATAIATVASPGVATGVSAGTATITATSADKSGSATLTVTPATASLGSASTFGSFGGDAGITNQGAQTVINGDIGTTGASTLITGFHDPGAGCVYTETPANIGSVTGKIFTAAPPPTAGCPTEGTAATAATATQALADAQTAFNNLSPVSVPGGTDPGAGELGGLTLAPGVYQAAGGSFQITGSDLILDGQGNANASWVFQMASTLTVGAAGAPRSVLLNNGAQAKNVFWRVGSGATINAEGGGTMVGTIISSGTTTISSPGNAAIVTLNGRALALTASVTMVNTVINVPPS